MITNATLKAGTSINLKPGFTAGSGNNFTAKIEAVTDAAKRFYYLKDHLGSIRVVVNELGEIVSSDDGVYPACGNPWGMILTGRSSNEGFANDKYKFTGKERDVETGYDYFGARYYDSRIARWLQVDPLAEKYPSLSTYNYTLNNPINLFDPDGRWPYIANNNMPTLNEIKSRFSGLNFPSNVNVTHQSLLALYKTYIQSQAPKVANWWEHTTFSVTVSSNLYATESAFGITTHDLSVPGIVIDRSVLGDPKSMAKTLLHESVHNMKINGEYGSEFAAWGATLASGLLDETTYLKTLQTAWQDASIKGELSFGYMTSGMDDKLIEMVSQYSSSTDKGIRAKLGSEIISRLKEEGSRWIK